MTLFTGVLPEATSAESVRSFAIAARGQRCRGRPDGGREAWIVMAHNDCVDEVRALLAITEFQEVGFPDLEDYPAEESRDRTETTR